jgi:hypothetical protein
MASYRARWYGIMQVICGHGVGAESLVTEAIDGFLLEFASDLRGDGARGRTEARLLRTALSGQVEALARLAGETRLAEELRQRSAECLETFARACLKFQSAAEGGLAAMVESGVHLLPRGLPGAGRALQAMHALFSSVAGGRGHREGAVVVVLFCTAVAAVRRVGEDTPSCYDEVLLMEPERPPVELIRVEPREPGVPEPRYAELLGVLELALPVLTEQRKAWLDAAAARIAASPAGPLPHPCSMSGGGRAAIEPLLPRGTGSMALGFGDGASCLSAVARLADAYTDLGGADALALAELRYALGWERPLGGAELGAGSGPRCEADCSGVDVRLAVARYAARVMPMRGPLLWQAIEMVLEGSTDPDTLEALPAAATASRACLRSGLVGAVAEALVVETHRPASQDGAVRDDRKTLWKIIYIVALQACSSGEQRVRLMTARPGTLQSLMLLLSSVLPGGGGPAPRRVPSTLGLASYVDAGSPLASETTLCHVMMLCSLVGCDLEESASLPDAEASSELAGRVCRLACRPGSSPLLPRHVEVLLFRMMHFGVRLQMSCLRDVLLPLARSAADDPATYAPVLETLLAQPGCGLLFLHLDCPAALFEEELRGDWRQAGGDDRRRGRDCLSVTMPASHTERLVCMAVDQVRSSHPGRCSITVVTPTFTALIADVMLGSPARKKRYVSFVHEPETSNLPMSLLYGDGVLETYLPESMDARWRHPRHVRGKLPRGTHTLHTQRLLRPEVADPSATPHPACPTPPPAPRPGADPSARPDPACPGDAATADNGGGGRKQRSKKKSKGKKKSKSNKRAETRGGAGTAGEPCGGSASSPPREAGEAASGGDPPRECPACARATRPCRICEENCADNACKDCGHVCLCEQCAVLATCFDCPVCGGGDGFFKIYRASHQENCLACGHPNIELCVICFADPVTRAFKPCGHLFVCDKCDTKLFSVCPVCRKEGVLVRVAA